MQNIRIDDSEGEASEYSRVQPEGEVESEEGSSMEEDESMENPQVYEQEEAEGDDMPLQKEKDKAESNGQAPSAQKTQEDSAKEHQQSPCESPIALVRQDSSTDEVQSEYTYDQLSQQLQRALCKIQSKETVKSQTFLDRVRYFEKKKHCALQQRKQEQELENTRLTARQAPTNAHSQRILQQYQPIQERSSRIVEEKRRKLERQQLEKRMREEEAVQRELGIKPQPKKEARSREEFLSGINSWQEQKERKIAAMAQREIRSEMDGVTFQPKINSHSKAMVQRIGKVPIQEREIRSKKVQLDQECTFKPKLNKGKR